MSSRRRHAYDKGLFYPSIKCNYPPTYRQKKGMILQRGPSLPSESITSSSRQSEVAAIRKSLNSNILKNISSTFDLSIPASTSYIQSLDNNVVIPIIKQKFGIIYDDKILSLSVDQFSLVQKYTQTPVTVPTINWVYYCGDSSVTPISITSGYPSSLSTIPFDMPTPYFHNGTQFNTLRGPYFNRNSNKDGGVVTSSQCNVTGDIQDFRNYLAMNAGPFYWYLYQPGLLNGLLHTEIVINNDTTDADNVVRVHFNLQYIA